MSEHFDAYHEWLGIPKEEQPPHHYRLLGIKLFEASSSVIEHAADQRMAHLRTLQTGKHSAFSQRLLNEVAAARVCLLKPEKKAAYDAKLRETLDQQASPAEDSDQRFSHDMAQLVAAAETASPRTERPGVSPSSAKNRALVVFGAIGAIGVLLVGLFVWFLLPGGSTPSREKSQVAVTDNKQEKAEEQPQAAVVTQKPSDAVGGPDSSATGMPKAQEAPSAPKSPPAAVAPPTEKLSAPPEKENVPSAKPAMEPKMEAAQSAPTAGPPSPAPIPQPLPPAPAQQQPPPKPETPAPQAAPKQKSPVPDEAALAQARTAADALFKSEIDKAKTPADKVALARRLLAQATTLPGVADRYVLMLMARDLAASAKNADRAFQVVDQMAEAFEVDRLAMKIDILTGWAKEVRTPEARKSLVEQTLVVGDEALDAGNLDAAQELGKLATGKSTGLRDTNVMQKLKDFRQRFVEASKDAAELKAAQATLAQDPKDPKANLVAGQYFCFTKGDWKKGLPLLALGSDATLKGLASQELTAPPSQADAQVALADAWWETAQIRRRSHTSSIKRHAGQWYAQADAGLSPGLVRNKVEQRLREVAKLRSQLSEPPLAIAPFDRQQARQHQQRWAAYLGVPVEITNSIGMKLVLIPPGEFNMGSTPEQIAAAQENAKKSSASWALDRIASEAPQHRVRISRPYYLGVYEVTQAEYAQVMGVNPSGFTEKQVAATQFKPPLTDEVANHRPGNANKAAGKDSRRYPVETVSWEETTQFCQKLSALPGERAGGRMYRLPTEAEWEYACRAGSRTHWSCGDEEAGLLEHGWFNKNADGMTHAVGQKKPNPWDLYDVHGNVWEWCLDWYGADYYGKSAAVDPPGPSSSSSLRVDRGGSFWGPTGSGRSAFRGLFMPGYREHGTGFRACLVLAE